MFTKKQQNMAKFQEPENKGINIISAGTEISGDIHANGDIRIDGKVKGNLKIAGKLVLGEQGFIEGNVNCKNADISGKANIKLIVSELLALKSSSDIVGDIITSKLSIEPGAKFSGTCKMSNADKLSQPSPSLSSQTNHIELEQKASQKAVKTN
jgi:cytoskeletal protein CcmA (bactofilin family)